MAFQPNFKRSLWQYVEYETGCGRPKNLLCGLNCKSPRFIDRTKLNSVFHCKCGVAIYSPTRKKKYRKKLRIGKESHLKIFMKIYVRVENVFALFTFLLQDKKINYRHKGN